MLGLLYLILSVILGWAICLIAFPGLENVTKYSYRNKAVDIHPYFLLLPVWFLCGTLVLTWSTYLFAVVFSTIESPLFLANGISMSMAAILSGFIALKRRKKTALLKQYKMRKREMLLLVGILLLASILMWVTFYVKGDQLYIGVSVFSDFSPHIGMIRSFSYGHNFPTSYSHFAGEDIRYHFMFQFLVGNLEYLGLRIDYAFNLPSIISFVSAFSLLYVLAVKITGSLHAGVLSCVFFAFRSSKTLFTYLASVDKGTSLLAALKDNTEFIGATTNENWGLWNLNVYGNQRHLAFGFATVFFILILLLPLLYEMVDRIGKRNGVSYIHILFFSKEGWRVQDVRRCIACGILLGSLSFFHGAAVIGCLLILFVVAVLANRRLEFLIVAVITVLLSVLQTHFFIHGSPISPTFLFGFIAENKTIFGVVSYLERLLGILPIVVLAAFCLEKWSGRYLILAFSAPLLFAFYVSLTVDVTVNHKYIMLSTILLGVFAAGFVVKLFQAKDIVIRFVSIMLIFLLTATGVYDFITVINRNTKIQPITLSLNDELTNWIQENSDAKDIFLTSNYTINQVVLGGAMLFQGWQYYAWSAGYDTVLRDQIVKEMYEATMPNELDFLVKENNIRFIIVDHDNRVSSAYLVNEENIQHTYQCVYQKGEGEWKTSIYDTQKSIFN